jgi:excisionase family DNA binding protein
MATKLTPKKLIGDFITLKQLLQSVPVSDRTIRNWIDAGKLRAYKLDGKLVFNVLDIEAFLQRRRVGGGSIAPVVKLVSQEQVRMMSDQELQAVPAVQQLQTFIDHGARITEDYFDKNRYDR